jgi:hypothetical protein
MSAQRTNQVSFMGRVGYVSGLDAKHDAAVMLVQETLLACYARVAIQEEKNGKLIVLRGVEIEEGGTTFGRHFILLPKEGKHDLFKVEFVGHTVEEPVRQTFVKTNTASYKMRQADQDTIVDTIGTRGIKLSEIKDGYDAPGHDLYYIDVRNQPNSNPVWKDDSFHMFIVRSTEEASIGAAAGSSESKATWRYVAFFNRQSKLDARMNAINLYMRHLIAGNISVSKSKPIHRHSLDKKTGEMKKLEGEENIIRTKDTSSDKTSNKLMESSNDHPIIPSVIFDDNNAYVLSPQAHPYAGLLIKYIEAIRSSIVYGPGAQVIDITSTRKAPDYTLAIGMRNEDLLIFTTASLRKNQQRTSIAVRDSNIARILFGSNPEWAKLRTEAKTGISAPGFGSLDYHACKTICAGSKEAVSASRFWRDVMYSKNKELNEMLGLTSEEIDQLLFPDSSFFRSFVGQSRPYVEAVAHWMREAGMADQITEMQVKVQRAYMEALDPYIRNVIANVKESLPRESDLSKGDQGYLVVLQEGHKIEGFKGNAVLMKGDTTKLLYEVDKSDNLSIRDQGDDTFKRADGGVFLYMKKLPYLLAAEGTLTSFSMNSGVSPVEIDAAVKVIDYSLRCPYGYVAHIYHKILRFSGNHAEFFSLCKVSGNPRYSVSFEYNKSFRPCIVTNNNGVLSGTNVQYFTEEREDPLKSGFYQKKIRDLSMLKEAWMKYIYTYPFVNSITHLRDESKDARNADGNNESLLGICLARLLREKHGAPKNIYELLPYNSFNFSRIETKGRERGGQISVSLQKSYPNLYMNFVENCDDGYRAERILLLEQAQKVFVDSEHSIRESEITNLDLVNGFLLSGNFSTRINMLSGFFDWKQYLALSASVIYAQDGVNEYMTFLTGSFELKRTRGISLPLNDEIGPDSRFIRAATVKDSEGTEFNVTEYINKSSKDIVPNIADVPVFSDGGPANAKIVSNAIVASTLNEALSASSNYIYFLARAIYARSPENIYSFDFGRGRGPSKQRAIENTESRMEVTAVTWSVKMNPLYDTGKNVEERSVDTRDRGTIVTYTRRPRNTVERIREIVTSPGSYLSRADRMSILISNTAHDRLNLSKLKPEAALPTGRQTIPSIIIQQRKGVIPVLRRSDNPAGNIYTDKHAQDEVNKFLAEVGLGVTH